MEKRKAKRDSTSVQSNKIIYKTCMFRVHITRNRRTKKWRDIFNKFNFFTPENFVSLFFLNFYIWVIFFLIGPLHLSDYHKFVLNFEPNCLHEKRDNLVEGTEKKKLKQETNDKLHYKKQFGDEVVTSWHIWITCVSKQYANCNPSKKRIIFFFLKKNKSN